MLFRKLNLQLSNDLTLKRQLSKRLIFNGQPSKHLFLTVNRQNGSILTKKISLRSLNDLKFKTATVITDDF